MNLIRRLLGLRVPIVDQMGRRKITGPSLVNLTRRSRLVYIAFAQGRYGWR